MNEINENNRFHLVCLRIYFLAPIIKRLILFNKKLMKFIKMIYILVSMVKRLILVPDFYVYLVESAENFLCTLAPFFLNAKDNPRIFKEVIVPFERLLIMR